MTRTNADYVKKHRARFDKIGWQDNWILMDDCDDVGCEQLSFRSPEYSMFRVKAAMVGEKMDTYDTSTKDRAVGILIMWTIPGDEYVNDWDEVLPDPEADDSPVMLHFVHKTGWHKEYRFAGAPDSSETGAA